MQEPSEGHFIPFYDETNSIVTNQKDHRYKGFNLFAEEDTSLFRTLIAR